MALETITSGATIYMYGVPVGIALIAIEKGGLLTVDNVKHSAAPYKFGDMNYSYSVDVATKWKEATFDGYYRRWSGLELLIFGYYTIGFLSK